MEEAPEWGRWCGVQGARWTELSRGRKDGGEGERWLCDSAEDVGAEAGRAKVMAEGVE